MNTKNNLAIRLLRGLVPTLAALAGTLACDLNATSVDADASGDTPIDIRRYEQGVDGAALADENCPYPQWDCTQLAPACARDVSQGAALGCVCNRSRPLTVADCDADESLFCLAGTGLQGQTTWDGNAHIQCACAPTPPENQGEAGSHTCSQLFRQTTADISMRVATGGCGRNWCFPSTFSGLRSYGYDLMCACQ